MLRTQELTVRYSPESQPILAGLSLEFRPGEMVGIVGPNGSGKSTLVRALARTLRPAGGVVLLDEHDLYRQRTARQAAREIGVVPQETGVAFDFTVRDVVAMGRAPHLPRRPFVAEEAHDREIIERAMRLAGVSDLAPRPVTTLSGGERQRVLFARALAQEPRIILLDEPTAHLDLRHQTQVLALARDLAHREGKAVLAVLHDLNQAAAFCDRLILLRAGQVEADGPPAQALTPDHIRRVYGASVWVRCHPASGRPMVLTLPEVPLDAPADGPRVHVLCGGGTGAELLAALKRRGCRVTVGGLNTGDSDADAADLLQIPGPREAPFSALSESVQEEATRLREQAEYVILTEVPFGPANLAHLRDALTAARSGQRVLLIQPPGEPFSDRDFTGGEAGRLWEQTLQAGATPVASTEDALRGMA